MTIRKTATTTDWRARRGEACLVPAPKSYRPDLQAEPFDAGPRRAFFPRPGSYAAAFTFFRFAKCSAYPAQSVPNAASVHGKKPA